jgi:outer membrane protein assembly factor BamB
VGQGLGGPVVAGGKVILADRSGGSERLVCRDALTGERRWELSWPTAYADTVGTDDLGPRATPAVADGRVVAIGAEGKIQCADLEKGERLWSLDARERFGAGLGYFGLAGSPLIERGLVLLNIGGKPGAGIVALDLKSGAVRWQATDDEASCASPVAATLGGKRRALFFTRTGFKDLDPESGAVRFEQRWRARYGASVNAATPLVSGERVFLTASYETGALCLERRGESYAQVWSNDDSLSCHYATPVLRDGFLYGFHGRQEHGPSLRCVELATGKVRWNEDRFGAGSVTLAGSTLVLLREDGELVLAEASPAAFRRLAGAKILGGAVRSHPALVEGKLLARSGSELVCVDLGKRP